jgi:aspartate kinase
MQVFASQMFRVLSQNNINIDVISTSEIKISVLINKDLTEKALNTLHDHFELGNTTN